MSEEKALVLNTRLAQTTHGPKESSETYANMLIVVYNNSLLQALNHMLVCLQKSEFQQLNSEIDALIAGANFIFAERIVEVAKKLDNAARDRGSSELEIYAIFEELLKEAKKLKIEIMKYLGKPITEDDLDITVRAFEVMKGTTPAPKINITSMGIEMDKEGRSDGCNCSSCVIF